ncbi:MAG: thymidine kinase [Patescibacteria group bacterium]|nr:thymidine kinase [Patescibacteria group bacterium]
MSERLHVVTGCMFAGKTTELMRLGKREEFAGNSVMAFKPSNDTRSKEIMNHNGERLQAIQIDFQQPEQIFNYLSERISAILIDEAQFFGSDLPDVVKVILRNGIRVYLAGLQNDFRHEGFGPMPALLGMADKITVLYAVCTYDFDGKVCGMEASRTQRLINGQYPSWDEPVILIGASESYAPRCANHHIVLNSPYKKLW